MLDFELTKAKIVNQLQELQVEAANTTKSIKDEDQYNEMMEIAIMLKMVVKGIANHNFQNLMKTPEANKILIS